MELVATGRDMRTQQVIDFERLFIADKRHDAKAERLTCAIVLILALFHRRGDERGRGQCLLDRKSTRLNSSHGYISYAVFCLKKKNRARPAHGTVHCPLRRSVLSSAA